MRMVAALVVAIAAAWTVLLGLLVWLVIDIAQPDYDEETE